MSSRVGRSLELNTPSKDPIPPDSPLGWVIVAVCTSVIGFILDRVFNNKS